MTPTPEQRERLMKLADELDSGKRRQGNNYLRFVRGDGTETFCCLGVGSEMAVEAGVIPPPIKALDTYGKTIYLYGTNDDELETEAKVVGKVDGNSQYLCKEVQEWFGISREGRFPIAVVVPHDDQSEEPVRADTLVSCNDDFGMDFHQIATAIREAF